MTNTLADLVEAHAATVPDQDAIVHGERRVSWARFDRRASGFAATLLDAGLDRGDRVALYLYSTPEYLESHVGALKASFAPVNTNYRYVDDELVHLWDDADAMAVVFDGSFTSTVERVRQTASKVRLWLWVDDGTGECPVWADTYEDAVAASPRAAPWPRSESDRFLVYTGGTTGMPKGVMWDQRVYFAQLPLDAHDPVSFARTRASATRNVVLPAAPLMHGTGAMAAVIALMKGGTVVLPASRHFDPADIWTSTAAEGVGAIALVGDAFARPMADALDLDPNRWDLTALRAIMSAGVMFSAPVKRRLLDHLPWLKLVDQFGSSENGGGGFSISDATSLDGTGTFRPAPGVRVLDDRWRDVEPGSGKVGVVAIPGGAAGYHKDPEKSSRTWPVIDGKRYTVAGDYATVEADGTMRLLGRGSVCINTGGEKVYPEEVEEILKSHVAVRDAIVVGIPHERFGQSVAAVIETTDVVDDRELLAFARQSLAAYKVPSQVLRVDSVGRAANGKADYAGARELVLAGLA